MIKKSVLVNVFWILLAEAVGLLSGWISSRSTAVFQATVLQPPLSPPAILFPIVWAVLYALMGIGIARVSLTAPSRERRRSLYLFVAQLIVNFFWSPIFFILRAYGFALCWLLLLIILVNGMMLSFRKTDPIAALLQFPYWLWLIFAAYLNYGVWRLNSDASTILLLF